MPGRPNSQVPPFPSFALFPPRSRGRAGPSPPSRPRTIARLAALLARSARGGPRHVTAAGARARRRGPLHLSRAPGGRAWTKPTTGAAPALPCERYPPPKHIPRSPVSSVPAPGSFYIPLVPRAPRPRQGGVGGCERACCPPPVGHGAFLSGVHSSSPEPPLRNSTRERSPPSFLLLFPPHRPPLPTSPPSPAVRF